MGYFDQSNVASPEDGHDHERERAEEAVYEYTDAKRAEMISEWLKLEMSKSTVFDEWWTMFHKKFDTDKALDFTFDALWNDEARKVSFVTGMISTQLGDIWDSYYDYCVDKEM